jgi:hypothetical protein
MKLIIGFARFAADLREEFGRNFTAGDMILGGSSVTRKEIHGKKGFLLLL